MGNFTDFMNTAGGGAVAAAGMGLVNNVSNLVFGRAQQKQQLKGYKESLAAQNAAQMDIWNKTNYEAQMKHMKAAGLNPALMYGMGGGGGATTGGAGAMPSGGSGMGIIDPSGMAQMRLLEAQAEKLKVETENLRTEGIGKKTNNIILDILKDKESLDYQDYYDYITDKDGLLTENPNRTARREANAASLLQQKAAAETLTKLYQNGTMQKMTEAELNNKLAEIGLKDVNIKGKEIENALNDMEKKLMESLNLGKQGKGWIDSGINLIMNLIKLSMRKRGK